MPGDLCPTASTLAPRPIACRALTACGLVLTAAPISPSAGACSNTSVSMPTVASDWAVARPASPPPTIAILQLDAIRPSASANQRFWHLGDVLPSPLNRRQVQSALDCQGLAHRDRPKRQIDPVGGEQRERQAVDAKGDAGGMGHRAALGAQAPGRAEMVAVIVEADARGQLLGGADRDQQLELERLLDLVRGHQLAAAAEEQIARAVDAPRQRQLRGEP